MKGTSKLNSDLGPILLSCKTLLSSFQSYILATLRDKLISSLITLQGHRECMLATRFLISVQPVLRLLL